MRLFAVGLSHRSAPVELRERVDFSREGIERALDALAARGLAREMVVLSTCNRSEVYAALERDDEVDALAGFFSEYHGVPRAELAVHLYVHRGAETARHVFRVAAGLDSLVVGEPQVFGQVKAAYTLAADRGLTGALTNRLFHAAFSAGKRVRAETGLSDGAVSVSYAAVSLARKIFGTIKGRTVFIAGAGEMAALTGVHLKAQQAGRILIASRTAASAGQLAAELEGEAIPWAELAVGLAAADVAVTATGASIPVVSRELVQDVMRQRPHRPLFIIDIAVPRDVEPAAGDLEQVFVYNIDDLQQIVKDNLARRGSELSRAESIVEEETSRFVEWLRSREVIPTVVALRQRFETIRRAELKRLDSKLAGLPPDARARVDEVTRLVVEKLLLSPTEQLKTLDDETMVAVYSEALNRLFSLDSEAAPHNDPGDRS
jgi:glutamyl-tRNA reductase